MIVGREMNHSAVGVGAVWKAAESGDAVQLRKALGSTISTTFFGKTVITYGSTKRRCVSI